MKCRYHCRVQYLYLINIFLSLWCCLGSMVYARPVGDATDDSGTDFCNKIMRLSRKQRAFCLKNPQIVKAFEEGFKLGIKECIHRFSNNSLTRWNCTNIAGHKNRNVLFGVALGTGTKEGAAMHAFIAAGMLYNLVRKCIDGGIPACTVNILYSNHTRLVKRRSGKSCKDINWTVPMNFLFGFLIPRGTANFLTAPNRHMNDINHAVGAVAVMRNTIHKYGCSYGQHGMQACPFARSCREVLPDFKAIGDHLVQKYKTAKLIRLPSQGLQTAHSGPDDDDDSLLTFYKKSPTYCGPDRSSLWGGIGGRRCRPQVNAKDSCNVMCCGFGYMTIIEVMQHNCKLIAGQGITLKCDTYEEYRHYCKFEKMVIRKGRWVGRKKNPVPLAEVQLR